jgi:hypothetical protein
MYEHFNAREVQLASDYMHADVDWPNALDGTRLTSLADVLDYWRGQFAQFDPRVYPVEFAELRETLALCTEAKGLIAFCKSELDAVSGELAELDLDALVASLE